ncbi:hypothetical protein DIS24_g11939 [Lasiodiplodia hormozganensis]|uniref:Uncharacterized protein n=1 Tax=Lasiodiplodia hormozganensis TaxID=869390 RepID=A0AA39WG58_9PEZI|nr:hypothetical protein DIS24_g11939 [Lasiodiplodia hormozganensis]
MGGLRHISAKNVVWAGGEAVIVIVDLVAAVPNSKTKKAKNLSKRDLYTSIFLQAQKEEWVFAADAPENAGRLWLAGYTEDVTTNTVNEDWKNGTGDTSAAGDWNEYDNAGGSGPGDAGDSAPVEW